MSSSNSISTPVVVAPVKVRKSRSSAMSSAMSGVSTSNITSGSTQNDPAADVRASPPPKVPTHSFYELETVLNEHGYRVVRSINIGSGSNAVLSYVKALYMGQPLYIDLDREYANISPSPRDLSVIEVIGGDTEYLHDNDWAERCTSIDCGTMFECSGRLCSIKRSSTNAEVQRADYVLTSKPQQRTLREEDAGLGVGYPVVRISEILANPKAVRHILSRHLARLRHQTMKKFAILQIETRETISMLSMVGNKLDMALEKAQDTVEDMYIARHDILDGLRYPPLPQHAEEADNLVRSFEHINEERENLYRDMAFLQTTNDTLVGVIEQLDAVYKDLRDKIERYKTLD